MWTDKQKIRDFIGRCKMEFRDNLEIVSGGAVDGADRYAKECALELGVRYIEFPPIHKPWNPYCPEPKYLYGKEYNVRNFFARNVQIVEYADRIAAFIPDGEEAKGTMHTVRTAEKLGKPHVIIS